VVTATNAPRNAPARMPGRRSDHIFFSAMVGLMLATVGLGFARTYFLAGVFSAPLRSRVLHIHGAIFSLWMLLLFTQVTFVAAHRRDIHRRLGIVGFFLAPLVVILGVLAAGDALAHLGPHPSSMFLSFSITPFTDMFVFGVLAGSALYARHHPVVHKRLILMATISMMRAAIFRWPFPFVFHNQIRAILISYIFVLLLIAYDLWATHKVQRATVWASASLLAVHIVRIPIGQTNAWHGFAQWFGSLGI
jgi:hypothetical protein